MMTMLRMTSETTELVSELKLAKNGIHTVFGLYLLSFQSVFVYFGRREMNGSDLLISKVTSESEIACPWQKLWSFEDESKSHFFGRLVYVDGTAREATRFLIPAGSGSGGGPRPKRPILTHFQMTITLEPDLRS